MVRPRSCRVIYYFDTPALGRRHQSFGRVKDQSRIIVYSLETLISWKSKKQFVVSCSSTKAEYRNVTSTCSELTWLQYLLQDLCISHPQAAQLYYDNQATLHIAANPVFHKRTKHIELLSHPWQDTGRSHHHCSCCFSKTTSRHFYQSSSFYFSAVFVQHGNS